MSVMMNKVDFFIIGAQKAATTSLYNYLNQHPDIYMPEVKENHFFVEDRVYNQGVQHFHRFYQTYTDQKLVGGAFVHMISSKEAPERVYKYNPDAKFLVMLRNPVDRAYSAYHFAIKNGWESSKLAFFDALKLHDKRLAGNLTEQTDLAYINSGLYGKHLAHWFKWFGKDRFLIMLDSDLITDSKLQMQKVFNFLGADETVHINTSNKFNKSGDVRIKSLHHFLRNKESKVRRNVGKMLPFGIKSFYRHKILPSIDKFNKTEKEYEPLSFKERETLFSYFEQDLKDLSALIDKNVYDLWKPVSKNTDGKKVISKEQ
jgi:hypothetical protein